METVRPNISERGIPIEEFQTTPEFMVPYQIGDKLVRANFMSYMIQSHDVRGSFGGQVLFLEWDNARTGNNYLETISNCLAIGGWASLSAQERQLFIDVYRSIPSPHHQSSRDSDRLMDGIMFDANLERILSNGKSSVDLAPERRNLSGYSYLEFKELQERIIKRYEDRRDFREELL